MPCPYAKNIRGTVAFCSLVKKKVSTLRFPCKGNYKRCPIYTRYGTRAPAKRKTKTAKKETTPQPAQPVRVEQPPRPQPPPVTQKTEILPSNIDLGIPRAPSPQLPHTQESFVKPSEALCDSLILAGLLTSGHSFEAYRDRLEGLLDYLRSHISSDKLIFIIGPVKGYSFRGLYYNGKLSFAFEKDSVPVCGAEAEKLFNQLSGDRLDAILYEVDWSSIPLWRDLIMKEFS